EPASYAEALAEGRPEACVHLAWSMGPGFLESDDNVSFAAATARFADSVHRAGCRRFVGVGTCFEYDLRRVVDALAEIDPTGPHTKYGAGKDSARELLSGVLASRCSLVWARLFFLYGPRESERRLVPAVARALIRGDAAKVTSGEQIRDFLHVA